MYPFVLVTRAICDRAAGNHAVTGQEGFHIMVLEAADRLPFALAESLWLVDVCNCSYEVAAASAGLSTHELTWRVHEARRQIAHRVRPNSFGH